MPSLTREEAVARAAMLDVSRYDVDLRLYTDGDTFDVTTTIDVEARHAGSTFLDLAAHPFTSLRLDGAPLDPAALDNRRFPLDLLATLDGDTLSTGVRRSLSDQVDDLAAALQVRRGDN